MVFDYNLHHAIYLIMIFIQMQTTYSLSRVTHDYEIIHFVYFTVLRQPLHIEPPAPEEVAKAREIRLNEMKMHTVLREIIFYFLFLALIILVASNNRDSRSFHVKDAIVKILTVDHNLTKVSITEIQANNKSNMLILNVNVKIQLSQQQHKRDPRLFYIKYYIVKILALNKVT